MVALRQRQAAEKKSSRRRECAARGCHEMFEPARNDQRYCSPRCRARQKMRRYREAHWNTETTDPETPLPTDTPHPYGERHGCAPS